MTWFCQGERNVACVVRPSLRVERPHHRQRNITRLDFPLNNDDNDQLQDIARGQSPFELLAQFLAATNDERNKDSAKGLNPI